MILVTGGAGFIGRHVVAMLRERGESVRVLDNPYVRGIKGAVDKTDEALAELREHGLVGGA